jgi:hypothetical protein
MVEPLAERTRDLYAEAEARLLGIIARQLAAGLDSPGRAERKLAAVQQLRRASQAIVDELGKAVTLQVFDVVAESYNTGHRAAVAELGALSNDARRLVEDITPNAQAVDRLALETVDRIASTHRPILRTVVDKFRAIVAEVTATPLLGTGTRRQATQGAIVERPRSGAPVVSFERLGEVGALQDAFQRVIAHGTSVTPLRSRE